MLSSFWIKFGRLGVLYQPMDQMTRKITSIIHANLISEIILAGLKSLPK